MIQPFERFQELYIARLINLNKTFLVSQTYTRAYDHLSGEHKTSILLTDYDDPGLAKIHLNAVKHDKYAAIIDLLNSKHIDKLKSMLQPTSDYELYWSIVKDVKVLEKRLNGRFTENVRRYITKNTNWRVAGDETIMPSFQVTFGELFIVLKRANQTLRVKFEEIEKS